MFNPEAFHQGRGDEVYERLVTPTAAWDRRDKTEDYKMEEEEQEGE